MNPVALLAIAGLLLVWLPLAAIAVYSGNGAAISFLALVTVAPFVYVPWARLRTGAFERSSLPTRFWINAAMLVICLAIAAMIVWRMAVRFGLR